MFSPAPLKRRCKMIGQVPRQVVARLDPLLAALRSPLRPLDSESLAAEIIPFCDACRFLARQGTRILKSRKISLRGRPLWLWGVRSWVHRVPFGRVLIIGTWNYPLLLPAVQIAQALAAGNQVLLKPAPGCEEASQLIASFFWKVGFTDQELRVLPSEPQAAQEAIARGVDLVVLTGSAATGRRILRTAAEKITPTILELSGCDAMVVLPGADLDRVADAIRFGLTLNSGATCIAPRRILVHHQMALELLARIRGRLQGLPPQSIHPAAIKTVCETVDVLLGHDGHAETTGAFDRQLLEDSGKMHPVVFQLPQIDATATFQVDVFAPIAIYQTWESLEKLVHSINQSPYALGVSIFGPRPSSLDLAQQLAVGNVLINDLIAPTADPRLPFGGRRESGFGVTRGAEGLLAMTTAKTVTVRRRGTLRHFEPLTPATRDILQGVLRLQFAETVRDRVAGLRQLISGVRLSQRKEPPRGGSVP